MQNLMRTAIAYGVILVVAAASGCGSKHSSSSGGGGGDGGDDSASSSSSGSSGGSGGGAGASAPIPPTVVTGSQADLYDAGVAMQYQDASAIPGTNFLAGTVIRNGGEAASGAFQVEFYATAVSLVPAVPARLGAVDVADLAPGAEIAVDLDVLFPAVPPDEYQVGWFIDPAGAVAESDETNNSVFAAPVLLVHDAYEPNDAQGTAWLLGAAPGSYEVQGAISTLTDEDWFSVTQVAGADIRVALGSLRIDCDLEIYAADGTLVASSSTPGLAAETISVPAPATGTYSIRVFGVAGAFDPASAWTLGVSVP